MPAPPVRRSPLHTATVLAATALTPRMRRITVRAQSMVGVPVRPAQDLEVWLFAGARRVKRRYTIRHARPATGELDLDVLLHGDGPGARWGTAAEPGDSIEFQGPRGKLELRSAPVHLLVGDESALPAIAAICEVLPGDERAIAVLEVRDAADELPVAAATRWIARGSVPPGGAELLGAAVHEIDVPSGTHGYLMGETRAMVALRALLEAKGVEHDAIFVKGYWNIGRPDRIAGRAPTA